MPDVFKAMLHKGRRKGISVIECIILMIIVGVAFGAIFTTAAWAQRSYTSSKQGKASRELLFSWVQKFESLWSPSPGDIPAKLYEDAMIASESVAEMMNGSSPTGSGIGIGAYRETRINGFTVRATNRGLRDERLLVLEINISTGNKTWVNLQRGYNRYSNETVSDDVVGA